jgi:hypothetical protein
MFEQQNEKKAAASLKQTLFGAEAGVQRDERRNCIESAGLVNKTFLPLFCSD